MSKIIPIKKSKTISFEDEMIEYFIEEGSNSSKKSYEEIMDKIKNAKETIRIASTSFVDENIIDAIYDNEMTNNYFILNSFEKSKKTLQRFDQRKSAIFREVETLENNFIIIDKISYFFINPLSQKENIYLYFDEKETSDLEFIFNYYFWNEASKEKLVDTMGKPIESPFPPFSLREQQNINVLDETVHYCNKLYIPRDKNYLTLLNEDATDKYFSDDIEIPIYVNKNSFMIGNFTINEPFKINNSWRLKQDSLGNIDSKIYIIPKDKNWSESISIKESKNISLDDIIAKTIESMNGTEPKSFDKVEYVKNITYNWNVFAPTRPKNSKKSSIYSEYEKYEKKLKEEKENKVKAKKREKEKLDKKDKDYKSNLKKLEKEIENLEKQFTKKETFNKPEYSLPTVGVLYELNHEYFLEITNREELSDAKNYIKKESLEDKCKIVASQPSKR